MPGLPPVPCTDRPEHLGPGLGVQDSVQHPRSPLLVAIGLYVLIQGL
jgi:hypothetical protein